MGQRLTACLGHISDLQRRVRGLKDLEHNNKSVSDLEHHNDVLMIQVQDLQRRVLDLEAKRAMLVDTTISEPSTPPPVYCPDHAHMI